MIQGNNTADKVAKSASKCQVAVMAPVVSLEPTITPEDIILIQQEASFSEQSTRNHRGTSGDKRGLWRSMEGLLVAPVTLLTSSSWKSTVCQGGDNEKNKTTGILVTAHTRNG